MAKTAKKTREWRHRKRKHDHAFCKHKHDFPYCEIMNTKYKHYPELAAEKMREIKTWMANYLQKYGDKFPMTNRQFRETLRLHRNLMFYWINTGLKGFYTHEFVKLEIECDKVPDPNIKAGYRQTNIHVTREGVEKFFMNLVKYPEDKKEVIQQEKEDIQKELTNLSKKTKKEMPVVLVNPARRETTAPVNPFQERINELTRRLTEKAREEKDLDNEEEDEEYDY